MPWSCFECNSESATALTPDLLLCRGCGVLWRLYDGYARGIGKINEGERDYMPPTPLPSDAVALRAEAADRSRSWSDARTASATAETKFWRQVVLGMKDLKDTVVEALEAAKASARVLARERDDAEARASRLAEAADGVLNVLAGVCFCRVPEDRHGPWCVVAREKLVALQRALNSRL